MPFLEAIRSPSTILHQLASPRFPSSMPTTRAHRKIAIAVDLSDESAFAVKWAVQNYLRPGDAVVLLHVQSTTILYGVDWGSTDVSVDVANEKLQQELEDDFDNFTTTKANDMAQPLVDVNIPFKIYIVKDHDMKERLCLEVERLGLSAVIMGRKGFGALRRSTKGRVRSVSDYCVQHYVCPIVVVRYPDEKDGGFGNAAGIGNGGSAKAVDKDGLSLHPVPEEEPEYHDASDKTTSSVVLHSNVEAEDQDVSLQFSEQDREKRKMLKEEWDRWVREWKCLHEEQKVERQMLRDGEASDEEDEYEAKEVEVEELLDVSGE